MSDWIKVKAKTHGNKVAITEPSKDGVEWTFKDLNIRAENLAHYLKEELGVQKGDRVGAFIPNDVSVFDLFFASIKIGAVFIPINWRLKPTEIEGVIEDSGLKNIFYATDHLDRLSNINPDYIKLDVDKEEYQKIVDPSEHRPFDSIKSEKDDLVMLLYTSGTTGRPKGVQLTHRTYLANMQQQIASWDIETRHKALVSTPLFHVLGLVDSALPMLYTSAEIVLDRFFDIEKINTLISEYKPNVLIMIPTMFYGIIAGANFNATQLKEVEIMVQGGAPPLPKVNEAFDMFGIKIFNAYGMTEAGLVTVTTETLYDETPESIGTPIMNVDTKIVGEDGEVVNTGELGELYIKGDNVTPGYYNLPEENKKAFTADGYFKTGDLARENKNGTLTLVNRSKELIITGGENVLPSEVEAVLSKHPLIRTAVVVGYENEKYGESVSAAVILNDDARNIDDWEETLNEFCLKNLAGYKTPKLYLELDEMPLTSVAKPDRLEIQRQMNEKAKKIV